MPRVGQWVCRRAEAWKWFSDSWASFPYISRLFFGSRWKDKDSIIISLIKDSPGHRLQRQTGIQHTLETWTLLLTFTSHGLYHLDQISISLWEKKVWGWNLGFIHIKDIFCNDKWIDFNRPSDLCFFHTLVFLPATQFPLSYSDVLRYGENWYASISSQGSHETL